MPGVRWVPRVSNGVGALILTGSSGRVDSPRAELFARHGALAEALQWFGGPGQHEGPWEIAIEFFIGRVEDLAKDCDRVLVVGTSFGSEAALLTGAYSDRVAAVVAFAHSDVVWAGIRADRQATSHWTLGGKPLPYVPFLDDWEPMQDHPAFLDLYRKCRDRFRDELAEAAIPVDRIRDVVVVAGGDDLVWPSLTHAEAIVARRHRHGLATTLVTDPDAGHRTLLPGEPVATGGVRMTRGGSEEADRRLGVRAWSHISARW